ncbi:MAG: hypothetical protein KAH06_04880, partial [Desulfobacterales bacterium]|nr:hypothetical protein [Desulfobacterales bacterium]
MDYRALIFVALLPSIVVWFFFWKYTDICLEDALITYRYAENIATGNGFVYNFGERVLGTTTPLYTLLLAAGAWIFGIQTIPVFSNIILAISGLLVGWFTWSVLIHVGLDRWLSATATLFLLVQPQFVVTVAGGMETMLVLALMAG